MHLVEGANCKNMHVSESQNKFLSPGSSFLRPLMEHSAHIQRNLLSLVGEGVRRQIRCHGRKHLDRTADCGELRTRIISEMQHLSQLRKSVHRQVLCGDSEMYQLTCSKRIASARAAVETLASASSSRASNARHHHRELNSNVGITMIISGCQ
jgi:hypothetical protein